MLSAQDLIDETLTLLKEPTDGTAHWSRTTVLRRLNMAQDEIALEIPDLLRTVDESLLTVASSAGYTIPSTVGKIFQVRVDGEPLIHSHHDSLNADAYRGEISESWLTDTGDPVQWFTINGLLYLYPYPSTAGQTITIIGELMLTEMTDSATSYPLENLAYMRKAQQILIRLAAAVCAEEDGNYNFSDRLKNDGKMQLQRLKMDWMVMKPSQTDSMLVEKISEDHG